MEKNDKSGITKKDFMNYNLVTAQIHESFEN